LSDQQKEENAAWRPETFWPVIISSFIFAIMHVGQGAAPVPLFFLALALGYLYRRTGSITIPLIVHMVLNGLTLVVETVRMNGW
jgi:membrane protease YdiL (CAAX protease family)